MKTRAKSKYRTNEVKYDQNEKEDNFQATLSLYFISLFHSAAWYIVKMIRINSLVPRQSWCIMHFNPCSYQRKKPSIHNCKLLTLDLLFEQKSKKNSQFEMLYYRMKKFLIETALLFSRMEISRVFRHSSHFTYYRRSI